MTNEILTHANQLSEEIEKIKTYIKRIEDTFSMEFYPYPGSCSIKLQNIVDSNIHDIFLDAKSKILDFYNKRLVELEKAFEKI